MNAVIAEGLVTSAHAQSLPKNINKFKGDTVFVILYPGTKHNL